MKIGMFTSGYQRNPLEEVFIDAKRFGYDYVELWGGRPHAFAPDLKAGDINIVKALIEKYEMPVRGYTPEHNAYPYNFMIGSEAMREDAVNYLKLCMDMGKEMGADFTLMSPAHAGYLATAEEIWERLIKTMRELAEHADKIGHKIVLEALTPYESNACKSANDLAAVFKAVPSENLVGMCDIVPPYVQNESIMAYFAKLGKKMYHMHIIDSDGASDSHIMPGEGRMPLREMFKEIKEIGFEGTAT
ncbi:MAG: fructoselysine 3-epimerase, partial [Bacillota bacterium]|nr:fructoselysine 3-epimerase [Bacillota bacterium]